MNPLRVVDLLTLDASGLQLLLAQGKLTSVSLVEQVLHQIGREDRAGANLRAMLSIAPKDLLLKTAAQLDQERQDGKLRGPLHGIPIIIKDAIATHPDLGMPTTVGSYALLSSRPARSAIVVEKLIDNGLIILGKTNMNEFCNWKGTNTTNGWSPVGGQTNSAYVIGGLREGEAQMGHSSPCGSSTGSAVGISAGYSPLALGTETDGSLVQPAGRAALFALKPTIGSVSLDGTWVLSTRFDTVGGMAKSTADLAVLTEMLLTKEARSRFPAAGLTPFLTQSFEGLRVGFLNPAEYRFPPELCSHVDSVVHELNSAYMDAISKIKNSGATVEYPVPLPLFGELALDGATAMSTIITYEYHRNVNKYLAGLDTSEVRSLKELIAWNERHADLELPTAWSNQERLIQALNDTPSEEAYENAKAHMHKVSHERGFDLLFGERGLNLIGVPMDSKIPSMAAASGYPIATMPLGTLRYNGRPFGLAIMAKAGREDLILQFMSAFEASFPKRVLPSQLLRETRI